MLLSRTDEKAVQLLPMCLEQILVGQLVGEQSTLGSATVARPICQANVSLRPSTDCTQIAPGGRCSTCAQIKSIHPSACKDRSEHDLTRIISFNNDSTAEQMQGNPKRNECSNVVARPSNSKSFPSVAAMISARH